jgi:polar amino acid transport system permease protein
MLDTLLAPRYLAWLLDGFVVTLLLSALVSIAALLLGLLVCVMRMSASRLLAWPARLYLSIFRNTPLLVQLFFWYFGVAAVLPESWMLWLNTSHRLSLGIAGIVWPPFEYLAGFIGLTLYSTAFIAEEFRSGVRGVGAGQYAAAASLGLNPRQIWLRVVMPQAVRIALPPLLGQVMNIIKNSSLTMAIGVAELSYASRQVETETFKAFQAFGVATVLYALTIAVIEVVGQQLQRRAWRGQAAH